MFFITSKSDREITRMKYPASTELVSKLIMRYEDKKERKKLRKEIRKNSVLTGNYLSAFGLINNVCGLTPREEACFNFINRCDKN